MDIKQDHALVDMTEPAQTMTAPRTVEGLLAAVSSEVRQAFLHVKKTVAEPEVTKNFDVPSPLPPAEPLIRFDLDREQRRLSFKKARQKNSYELITTHLLQALHNEAKIGHPSRKDTFIPTQREKISVVSPTVHTPKGRRNTRTRRSFLHQSSKDRHYYYRKHHRPTPVFVRDLAAKHRIGTDVDVDRLSESPDRTNRPSSEVKHKAQNKKPYMVLESSSLKEIGEFVKKNRQLQRITLPALGSNKIQTELIHLGDKQFKIPVLNFDQRAMVQRFKAARNNPALLSGIRVENYEPVENVVSVDGYS
ncbi:hypothetical protein RvY_10574-2 [Ramazzottius varieornatus]|uniref:Uncharacterized protein n=1 Tax=Ramazzottius varieornatus TaxID=947166 RepID=A0A1D1VD71_RAMVA|nr:hypothetical protein RvY_10574-2 [Ramazzottius varieornatus]